MFLFIQQDDEETKEPSLVKKVKGSSEGQKEVKSDMTIIPSVILFLNLKANNLSQEYVRRKLGSKEAVHERLSSGKAAASFTSTSFDLTPENTKRALTADEVKYNQLLGY